MEFFRKKIFFATIFLAVAGMVVAPALAQVALPKELQEKAELERQLQAIEQEIAKYQQELSGIKGEKNTLQNKIKQLQNQQASVRLQINSINLQIADLETRFANTQENIAGKERDMERMVGELEGLIRVIYERDNVSFVYTLVSQQNLSDMMDTLERYQQVSDSLRTVLAETAATKAELQRYAAQLTDQEEEARNLLSVQTLQQVELMESVSEQNQLLQVTKGREADYQIVISETQKKANEIRGRIYQLLGVNTQITFGEAVQIAQWVSDQVGVRAAFLLAILTQESSLGKNVGTCNRAGDPPEKSWRVVMKPERDQQPFLEITAALGLDPETTPVSCPMKDSKGNQVGWGGAMGPAQFIPSTWMGYKDKVAAVTGKTANPWDIRDAFIAAGIKLKADGAGTQEGEWAAAMRYFSGSTNTKYRFYGDSVVKQAEKYQDDIDNLK